MDHCQTLVTEWQIYSLSAPTSHDEVYFQDLLYLFLYFIDILEGNKHVYIYTKETILKKIEESKP